MKNKIILFLSLAVIVISIICSYKLLSNYHEEHKFDENVIESRKSLEPCSILNGAIERKKWDELALTDNFKNKYKTRDDIIPKRKTYTVFSCGYNLLMAKSASLFQLINQIQYLTYTVRIVLPIISISIIN